MKSKVYGQTGRRLFAILICSVLSPLAFGQVAVSSAGQPVYSYPIVVPPGIAGMAPQFNLAFSGSGPNGQVGHGWLIQGYSTITRCGATRSTDGKPTAVNYNAADKLCLDGQRLIQTNSSGLPSATQLNDARGQDSFLEFRTENDLYSRIRSYGMATPGKPEDGPAYIQVWTKAGQLFQYGAIPANTSALIRANPTLDNKTAAMVWAVSRVNDAVGNYMEFHYAVRSYAWGSGTSGKNISQEWYLTDVVYTGIQNASRTQLPDNKLAFVYEDRPDRNYQGLPPLSAGAPQDRSETWHQGSKNFSVKRLKAIDTYVNTQGTALRARRINLEYDNSLVTGRSRLISLEECFNNSALACRPKTKFEYAPDNGDEALVLSQKFRNNDLSHKVKLLSANGQYGVLTGDFDGDGRTDILRWAEDPTKNQLFLSKGEGSFKQLDKNDSAPPGDGVFNLPDQLFRSDGCYFSMVIDINGDGLADVLRYGGSRKLNGDSCGQPIADISHVFINNYMGSGRGQFTAVKIDARAYGGSSYATLVLKRTVSQAKSVYKDPCPPIDPFRTGGTTPMVGCTVYSWSEGNSFYLLDVNGDGRVDIVTAKLPMFSFRSGSQQTEACLFETCNRVYLGDGSGRFDEINPTTLPLNSMYSDPSSGSDLNFPKHVIDLDGDGLSDIVGAYQRYYNGSASWRSNGDGTFAKTSGAICDRPIDFNGDGRSDCLQLLDDDEVPTNTLSVSTGSSGTSGYMTTGGFNLGGVGNPLISPTGTPVGSRYGSVVLDLNGDGRSDILRWHDDRTLNRLYLSNGEGTFNRPTANESQYTSTQFKSSNGKFDFIAADFTGDGSTEILRLSADAEPNVDDSIRNNLYLHVRSGPPDLLLKVTTPAGLVTTLTYQSLPNAEGRYFSDRKTPDEAVYPKADVGAAMYVVSSNEVSTGVGGAKNKTLYAYKGLKASVDGRGLLGFREMLEQSVAPNGDPMTVSTSYLLDAPYIGMARRTSTRASSLEGFSTAAELSLTVNLYCDQTVAGTPLEFSPCVSTSKVKRPYLHTVTESGNELNGTALPTTVTTNVFNPYGDITNITVTTNGQVAGSNREFKKTIVNLFCLPDATTGCIKADGSDGPSPNRIAGDSWVLGRISRTTVQSTSPDLAGVVPSPGSNPNATNTNGNGLGGAVAPVKRAAATGVKQ